MSRYFENIRIPGLDFDLEATTENGIRRYRTPEGKLYSSITTVLSSGKEPAYLKEWRDRVGIEEAERVSRIAKAKGTKLHLMCEHYLWNNLSPIQHIVGLCQYFIGRHGSIFLHTKP